MNRPRRPSNALQTVLRLCGGHCRRARSAALALLLLASCSDNELGTEIVNRAPDTIISNGPPQGTVASFHVTVNWYGIDEDGEVVGYFYAWDDTSRWMFTAMSGSTFVVSARGCVACDHTDTQYLEAHTFWVKAVDNQGMHDPTPAHRTFTAESTAPITTITRGPCDRGYCSPTGRDVLIEWTSMDPDGGTVDSFFYKLNAGVLTSMVDSSWARVGADCTHVLFEDIDRLVLSTGRYNTFAVVAKDDAGAMERVLEHGRNWCCFDPMRDQSPEIFIWSRMLGERDSRVDGGPRSMSRPGEVFLGAGIEFRWEGDASEYGSRIAGYRYALDDTTHWTSWYLDYTMYPTDGSTFLPTAGDHVLYVQAVDALGSVGLGYFRYHVEPGPTVGESYGIMVVDDSRYSSLASSYGAWRAYEADRVEDEFFERIMQGYDYLQWDCLEQGGYPPPISLLGRYRTVLWYTDDYDGNQGELYELFHGGSRYLDPYVQVGGNLIMIGQNPGLALDRDCRGVEVYPFRYEDRYCTWGPPVPISFRAFGLKDLFYMPRNVFRGALTRFPGLYPDLPLGPLWPHITETDTIYLWNVEVFNSDGLNPNLNAIPIYDFDYFIPPGEDPDAVRIGQHCALIVDNSADPAIGSTAYLGWPLIWCEWDSAAVFMRSFLSGVCGEMPRSAASPSAEF